MYFGAAFLPIMYANLLPRTFRLCQAIGYGVGSLMLMGGGILMIVKMATREDDSEVALHQKVGNDDMELNGKLLAMAEVLGHSRGKLSNQQQPQIAGSPAPKLSPGINR